LPNEFALGAAATTTASTGSNSVDLVALAYDDSSTSTDLAGGISGGLQ
jgi:chorismate synthase